MNTTSEQSTKFHQAVSIIASLSKFDELLHDGLTYSDHYNGLVDVLAEFIIAQQATTYLLTIQTDLSDETAEKIYATPALAETIMKDAGFTDWQPDLSFLH